MIATFEQITSKLQQRAAAKSASAKQAAGDTPSEKDPAEKGTVAIPKDPNASTATMNLPANGTNTEVTPVTTVTPAKTISGEEKAATNLQAKAQKVAGVISGLLAKKATASEITPNLVSDKGNENKDTHPAPSTSNSPSKKQNPDKAVKDAAPATTAVDPNEKKVEAPKGDGKGALPKPTENTNDVTKKESAEGCMTGDAKAAADGLALDFDPTFHFKLASAILATEDGRRFAQNVLEANHGAAEAEDIIKAASFMEHAAAELEMVEAQGMSAAEQAWATASPEEQASIVKLASVHATAKATLGHDMLKLAYDQGAATAAGMQDQGSMDQDAGPDTDNITDEDIVAVLDDLVQKGQIKPEEAQAILQELSQGGAGGAGGEAGADPNGAAAGGAPGGDPMGGMPPGMEPGAGASPEEKEAFATVKAASLAVAAILATPAK
jgi:hypothetical protein